MGTSSRFGVPLIELWVPIGGNTRIAIQSTGRGDIDRPPPRSPAAFTGMDRTRFSRKFKDLQDSDVRRCLLSSFVQLRLSGRWRRSRSDFGRFARSMVAILVANPKFC